jgi:hypothetical protein
MIDTLEAQIQHLEQPKNREQKDPLSQNLYGPNVYQLQDKIA